ncbi:GldG family protein [Candidatus Roizmanbacteria bacterium]|nr:GldG family protein [Candidatus Roizmanbacteria bacterium]
MSSVSFIRYDASFGKAYTLSSSTKKILKNVDDVVTIKFFASSDLPTRLLPLKNDVVDLLNEFKKVNKGRINIKILDPKKDQNATAEVKESGIPELQFSQLERDKYAVTASYFGIALSYGDKKEVLPQVTDVESLEYNLTGAIYKLTKKETVRIGIIGQQDYRNPNEDSLSKFKEVMRQQYDISFLDMSSKSATKIIDTAYKTILIFDTNKKEFDPQEIQAIKIYLDNGGKAIFFVDGVWVEDNLLAAPAKHNLLSLLSDYGIKLNTNLVLSTSAELVNFGNGLVSFLSPYPFWVKTNVFDAKSSYFSNIQQLTFPWVSSLEGNALVKTTKRSWEQKDNYILNPQGIPQPQMNDLKEFTIVVESKEKKVVVIPSSRFIMDRFQTKNSGNLEFILNIVNDYASNGALSGIRQRAVSFYPIPDLPDNQKEIFKYGNILLLPLLFGLFGAFRFMKRK